jgi:hypothetical protein
MLPPVTLITVVVSDVVTGSAPFITKSYSPKASPLALTTVRVNVFSPVGGTGPDLLILSTAELQLISPPMAMAKRESKVSFPFCTYELFDITTVIYILNYSMQSSKKNHQEKNSDLINFRKGWKIY